MMYNKVVEDCFFALNHGGHLDENKPYTVCSHNQLSGYQGLISLCIQCEPCGIVTKACFRAQGNPYLLAGLEWVCRQLEGEPIHLHPKIDYQCLMKILDIPDTQYPVALRIEEVYRQTINKMQIKLKEVKT